jgi:flagellum-specific peptidoglycan hydrolase FlgJ
MAEKNKYTPESFVKEYAPIAQRIGDQIDVDPAILLAKFGLETGWGKSVIPNSYNLGNIKDFSGSGISAVDNSTKKADKYVQFQDPEVFADYYVDLIQRLYPNAIGAKSDMDKFAAGLVGPKG